MPSEDMIHIVIDYIERNLQDPLTLDTIATEFSYSKYYFHRMFKSSVGYNLHDYIRKRRLVNASKLLIFTDEKVIDIAFSYQFRSHEAFTRAFQSMYSMSPTQYRALMRQFISNKEEHTMESIIKGWSFTGTDLDKYTIIKDYEVSNQTQHSIRVSSKLSDIDPSIDFSNFMQSFKAEHYIGKRMRFSAFVSSEAVSGWSGLWMRVDDSSYNLIGFDNMSDRPIKGTTSWNTYACVLDIPKESKNINFGLILAGSGTVWIDSCIFEEVPNTVPTTDIRKPDATLPSKPINLELE